MRPGHTHAKHLSDCRLRTPFRCFIRLTIRSLVRPSSHFAMNRFMLVLLLFLTCFSSVAEAARLSGRGGKVVQPRVRPVMAGGVKQPPPAAGNTNKKADSKPKMIRIPFSPFQYDYSALGNTDLAFDMFWRSSTLL